MFPYTRPYNKHKLDFRSTPCTFLGYATNCKGYKCLDNNGRIYISRHGTFKERVFPFNKEEYKTTKKVYNPKVSIPTILDLHVEAIPVYKQNSE